MFDLVRKIFATRYVGLLEGEVARLRLENRALMNSLLGTAGIAPVEFPVAAPVTIPRVRKRSWHQIRALREAEAGRKELEG
jgi:hypothetical protein